MRTTILLFLISTLIVYGGLLLPQTLLIEEKIEINSASSQISEYLYDLPKWEKWLDWQKLQGTSDTKYTYSQFPKGVGAFIKFNENNTEKAQLYIQSISNKNLSEADFQKLKYIANFQTNQTHVEGEFELKSVPKEKNHSILNFTLTVDLGENPFVRYLAYLYYKPKIKNEATTSLLRLKELCENPIFARNK